MKHLIFVFLLSIPFVGHAQKMTSSDSVKRLILVNDTLRARLTVSNDKVILIKNYLKIVQKHPKNAKYLKGWITRAVQ